MNTFAWSFDRWLRCSLVTDPGYAPRSRLASGQNPGAPVVHVILNSLLWQLGQVIGSEGVIPSRVQDETHI
jgi:hypothetical protein